MNILVTGAAGFVGRNLVENLKNIKADKNKTRPEIKIEEIYEYDLSSTAEDLEEYCEKADFVFHLAGVNRPQNPEDFQKGNFGLASELLHILKKHKNKAPVMLSSSVQASLSGRFGASEYGRSKKAGEELFFQYAKETGAKVLVYRFPNIVGKWIRPNYNSAVGTFCHNIARDLPITVNDPKVELEVLFIDDLVLEMMDALEGKEHHCSFNGTEAVPSENGNYCYVPISYKVTLGYVVDCLKAFHEQPKTLLMPPMRKDSFEKKLYSMYLSYLPKDKIMYDLQMIKDDRGSFTEVLKTADSGQFSVNVSKPGITKGEHWHNSKWEIFVVVSGHGLIQERDIRTKEVIEFEVSGDKLQAIQMLPGYTHNIINLSKTENLVTLMWANESFDKENPDTYFEKVFIPDDKKERDY
jgi:NAD-dependent epimerase/dehydratase